MKKLSIFILSFIIILTLAGCSKQDTRQGAYYNGGTDDTDIVYGPIFTTYEGCKERAIDIMEVAYEGYSYCSKNCHSSASGTPICEDVVRSRAPIPGISKTFFDM